MSVAAEIAEIIPGDYLVGGRGYQMEASGRGLLIRYLRISGRPSSQIVAWVTGPNTAPPTGNGVPHAEALRALAAAPGRYRTAVRCTRCGAVLTDPASITRRLGQECWEQVHGGAGAA